jgi:hypothetical protein
MGWRESELSKREYCEERQLSVYALRYWDRRLNTLTGSGDNQSIKLFKLPFPIAPAPTTPLNFSQAPAPKTGLLVHVGTHRIEVAGDFEPFLLHKLVHTLRRV